MLDPTALLLSASYLGLFLIVFAETGLLIGFFLPGDTLLLAAGVLCAQGKLSLAGVVLVVALAAILGDSAGYAIGRRFGPAVFRRPDSRLFKPAYVERATHYFERYGRFTLVVARFIGIVRTVAPTLAGVSGMPYRDFLLFNVLGAVLWSASVTSAGYFLGRLVPDLDRYSVLFGVLVLVFSLLPGALALLRARLKRGPARKAKRPE